MRAITCPVSEGELRRLYLEEKLTDEAIAEHIGQEATVKRVRSWRHRFGIDTVQRTSRVEVPPIEGQLRSLLVGSMLGDGRLSRTANAARYQENHSDSQKDYLAWKVSMWGPWASTEIKPVVWRRPDGDFRGWRFHTVSHSSLLEWHALFYDGPVGSKRLDRRVVPLVDDFALAIWFMDDGSAGWWPRITFGMDPVSQGIALAALYEHGFHPRWEVHKGNTGDFIFEGEDQAHRFIALVAKHIPECMAQKLVFGFQGRHYEIRQTLMQGDLRSLAAAEVPIRQIAKQLGLSPMVISRRLKMEGIPHPRRIGRPSRRT